MKPIVPLAVMAAFMLTASPAARADELLKVAVFVPMSGAAEIGRAHV